MRNIIIAALVLLTGCASLDAKLQTIQKVYTVVTEATVPASAVTASGGAFVLAETAGTAYLTFCDGAPTDQKCSASTERLVIKSIRAGRSALNQLKQQIRTSPTASASLYNILVTALNSINATPAATFGAAQ